ncbi:MAG: FlgD immunoglobulin-like domain containing protein [Calditrichia bacterium]
MRPLKKINLLFLTLAVLAMVFFSIKEIENRGDAKKYIAGDRELTEEKEEEKKPNDWFYLQRAYPDRQIDFAAWRHAQQQAAHFRQEAIQEMAQWQQAGPTNIGGRITALAAHPNMPQRIWAGAADGGVWKTGNGGGEWIPVFDSAPSLSIGAVTVDPSDPNTIYVGTGEANSSGDSYPGNGIYRSTDAGINWEYLGLPESYYIGRIAVDPQNSQRIFVAATGLLFGKNAERGIYRTQNSGVTWEKVLFISDSTAAIDVAVDPVNPQNVFAAMWERVRYPNERRAGGITSGIFKSADGGNTWIQLTNGLPPNSPTVGRIGLSIARTNPQVVYAIYSDHPGYFMGLYKTTNGGQTWSRVNDGPLSSLHSSFGWYFGQVYVDPTNENTVYVMGVPQYKSTSGGNSWSEIGYSTHVDHHAIWVNPNNPSSLIIGNDGGLFTSNNGGLSFQKVMNLPLTQFYAVAVDYNNPQRLYGGTQDNGTLRTLNGTAGNWEEIYGGDGFYVIVDPNNSNVIYAESQYGGLGKSTNGGNYFYNATSGIEGTDRRNWMVPVVMNPNDSNTLYYGTYRVYRTSDAAGSWTPVSFDLSKGPYSGGLDFGTITTIDVSPQNSDVIFAGTDDGNVWVTGNSGISWMNIGLNLPKRWVTRLEAHPGDENTALVSFSGYKFNEYIGYVFKTTDRGQHWTDITANLPQAPVNSLVIDPDFPDIYYAATDVGVFFTKDGGGQWFMLGNNLPNSVVADLVLHQPTRTLIAATHGRSMFKLDISQISQIRPAGTENRIKDFRLTQNFPNPFNSQTQISFYLPSAGSVELAVFNIAGQKVKSLFTGRQNAGWYQYSWDGKDSKGGAAASGNYIYRLKTNRGMISKKMVLLK